MGPPRAAAPAPRLRRRRGGVPHAPAQLGAPNPNPNPNPNPHPNPNPNPNPSPNQARLLHREAGSTEKIDLADAGCMVAQQLLRIVEAFWLPDAEEGEEGEGGHPNHGGGGSSAVRDSARLAEEKDDDCLMERLPWNLSLAPSFDLSLNRSLGLTVALPPPYPEPNPSLPLPLRLPLPLPPRLPLPLPRPLPLPLPDPYPPHRSVCRGVRGASSTRRRPPSGASTRPSPS